MISSIQMLKTIRSIRRVLQVVQGDVYMYVCAVFMAALLHIKPLMSSLLQAKKIQHCT